MLVVSRYFGRKRGHSCPLIPALAAARRCLLTQTCPTIVREADLAERTCSGRGTLGRLTIICDTRHSYVMAVVITVTSHCCKYRYISYTQALCLLLTCFKENKGYRQIKGSILSSQLLVQSTCYKFISLLSFNNIQFTTISSEILTGSKYDKV